MRAATYPWQPVHETRLQTRWTDFDKLGHITHAAYPVYFDEARDAFLTATVGPFEEFPWVIAHVSIDYVREIRYPAPEVLVRDVIERLRALGATRVEELAGVVEKIVFPLPRGLHGTATAKAPEVGPSR